MGTVSETRAKVAKWRKDIIDSVDAKEREAIWQWLATTEATYLAHAIEEYRRQRQETMEQESRSQEDKLWQQIQQRYQEPSTCEAGIDKECGKVARYYHAEGCATHYRCGRHVYRITNGHACRYCGNPVELVQS